MESIWIGTIGNGLFLYDGEIQPENTAEVTLFSYSHDITVKLDKSVVKRRIIARKNDASIK